MIKEKTCLVEKAVVHRILDRSFEVIVPRYGIQRRVYIEDLIDRDLALGSQLSNASLKIYWKPDATEFVEFRDYDPSILIVKDVRVSVPDQKNALIQKIQVFDDIVVRIEVDMTKSPPVHRVYAEHPNSPFFYKT